MKKRVINSGIRVFHLPFEYPPVSGFWRIFGSALNNTLVKHTGGISNGIGPRYAIKLLETTEVL